MSPEINTMSSPDLGANHKVIAGKVLPKYASPAGLILGLRPANERQGYFVTTSLIDWAQT